MTLSKFKRNVSISFNEAWSRHNRLNEVHYISQTCQTNMCIRRDLRKAQSPSYVCLDMAFCRKHETVSCGLSPINAHSFYVIKYISRIVCPILKHVLLFKKRILRNHTLTLFTMWVLIINTNFATAEPWHFEMRKFYNKKNFWKKGVFYTGFEPGTTKTVGFWAISLPLDQGDKTWKT